MRTTAAVLETALQHCRAGRLPQAEALCREALAREPGHAGATNLLGRIAVATGKFRDAVELFERAIVCEPTVADHYNACAMAWQALGQFDKAIACHQKAVELAPDSPPAYLTLGRVLHEQGRLTEAVVCYQKAIALQPDYADAHCNLGVAFFSMGQLDDAVASYRRAIAINPESPEAHSNLSSALREQGKYDEAIASCERALELRPDYAEACCNLGAAFGKQERFTEAAAWFQKAIELRPDLPEPRYNLGCTLAGLDRIEEAIGHLEAALRANPNYWKACSALGVALQRRGRLDEALSCCRRAVQLKPDAPEALRNLGVVLRESGRVPEAIECFQKAVALQPDFAEAFNDMATAFQIAGQLESAVDACRRAIQAKPEFAHGHCSLGVALGELGLVEEAIAAIEKAVELKPDYMAAHSARLFLLNYSPRHDARAVFDEHKRWADTHARKFAVTAPPHANDRMPDRRLRIGYVSPDFRRHSVAFFLTPILAHHDHRQFEVICYSDVRKPDAMTQQLQRHADGWRTIAGLGDEQVAAMVREDRIDILVDLAVHSGSNRLLVFARKTAPVQVTYLGYAGTTGLATMDYKITDPCIDPAGKTEAYHTEKLVRLPDCYFCYQPPPDYPAVGRLPALERGQITFAAFQNLAKVSPQAVALWSRVLAAVPQSRLIIKARGLGHQATQQRLRAMFGRHRIGAEQLQIEDWGDMPEYLGRFGEVDIGLDTTPFNGGTTTFHSLWMGVPMITLAGQTTLGRMGASILSNLGLRELAAASPDDYVEIAVRLANDLAKLARLRAGLRERMKQSLLMDAPRFVRHLEAAYRQMWAAWCAKTS